MKKRRRKRNPELSYEAGDLILFADNTESLYKRRQAVVRRIVKNLNRGTYQTTYGRNMWTKWLRDAADMYRSEIGTRIPVKAIKEAAAEYESYTLKEIHEGEWEWVEELIKRRPNPLGSKHKVITKKRRARSAAQQRATRAMLAANKKRRTKKKVRRRNPTIRGTYQTARAALRTPRTPTRRNPVRKLGTTNNYGIKGSGKWFDGAGWTASKANACKWGNLKTCERIAQQVSDRSNKSVTVHTM